MASETAVRSNTEIIREYTRRVFNEHNPDLAPEYLAPEMKWHGGLLGTVDGPENVAGMLRGFIGALPDLRAAEQDIVAAGDTVAVRYVVEATHAGNLLGIEPTGRRVRWDAVDIYHLADGMIVEEWAGDDVYQVGAYTPPCSLEHRREQPRGGFVMNDLLETVIEAHGGLERWNELDSVSVRLTQGGALWALKGQAGVLDDVVVTARLHQERASHRPFGAADRRSSFTPERVAIENGDGTVLEALDQPRASFAGHTTETPWSTLQLAYFVGTAMWTYVTQPFTFAMPGFQTSELEPWEEGGEQWRRLRVIWPSYLATHSTEQTLYFDKNDLLARHDYDVEISGGTSAAHYVSDYADVGGIRLPTKHRIFPRTPDGQSLAELLIVSIDLSEIAFTGP